MDQLVVVGHHILRHEHTVFVVLAGHFVIVPDLVGIGARFERLLANLVGRAVFQVNVAAVGHVTLLGLGGIGGIDHLDVSIVLFPSFFGIERSTGRPEGVEELLHGIHVVCFHQVFAVVAFRLGTARTEAADVLAEGVDIVDVSCKSVDDSGRSNILKVHLTTWIVTLEENLVGSHEVVAPIAHFHYQIIVARRQVLNINGIQKDIHRSNIQSLDEVEVIHLS